MRFTEIYFELSTSHYNKNSELHQPESKHEFESIIRAISDVNENIRQDIPKIHRVLNNILIFHFINRIQNKVYLTYSILAAK